MRRCGGPAAALTAGAAVGLRRGWANQSTARQLAEPDSEEPDSEQQGSEQPSSEQQGPEAASTSPTAIHLRLHSIRIPHFRERPESHSPLLRKFTILIERRPTSFLACG